MQDWQTRRKAKQQRMRSIAPFMDGVVLDSDRIGRRAAGAPAAGGPGRLEGDNQKQADFLARSLAAVDPAVVHDLHLLISSVSLPEHLDVFEKGICRRIDFAYAGPQSVRMAQLIADRDRRGRRHPHLRRALCADVRRPDPRRRAAVRGAGRPRGEPLHRPEHRGHADDRRGRRVQRRRGRRAGQRDRRQGSARRHPG